MTEITAQLSTALAGRYVVEGQLGAGGMATVYEATDRDLRRRVAIKVLPPALSHSADYRARFAREARTVAALSHPNIVPIYDVGESADLVWFVMALVEGESLRAKVEREGPQPLRAVRRVLQEVAQALAYAHAGGVVHRDIKPDNILIERDSGRALVTDFGIAKVAADDDIDLTGAGEIVGTARYMAPEQALAEPDIDSRADAYSLGLVGFFLLTGSHAVTGDSLPAIITQHARGFSVPYEKIRRRVPERLITALKRCTAQQRDDRPARMEDLLEALQEMGGDIPETPPAVRSLFRDAGRALSASALALAGLVFVGVANVPAAFSLLVIGGVGWMWIDAVERATRSGVTWGMIRRALYVQRVHRSEEVRERKQAAIGPLATATFVAVAAVSGLLGIEFIPELRTSTNRFDYTIRMDQLAAVTLVTGLAIGVLRRRSNGWLFRNGLVGLGLAIGGVWGVMIVGVAAAGAPIPITLGFAGTFLFVIAVFLVASATVVSWGVQKVWQLLLPEADTSGEWRVPRWLDITGSWLFARVVKRDRRIGLERDRPVGVPQQLDLGGAKALAKRIDRIASAASGSLLLPAGRARSVSDSLLTECKKAHRRLRVLTAKIARLHDGVLVSKTEGLEGSLEGELDQIERELDHVQSEFGTNLEFLDALLAGLSAAVEAHNTAALDAALAEASTFATAVDQRAKTMSEVITH